MIPVMVDSEGMEVWFGVTHRDLEGLIRAGMPYVKVEGTKKRRFLTATVTEFFRTYQVAEQRKSSRMERAETLSNEIMRDMRI